MSHHARVTSAVQAHEELVTHLAHTSPLSQEDTRVLEAVPVRTGRGPARIAIAAGVDFDTVMRCLGGLAAAGFVERCERGWRLRRPQPRSHVGPNA